MPHYYNSDFKLAAHKKKFSLICFPLGIIYCDQEPLWLLNVIELLTHVRFALPLNCLQIIFLRGGG